MIVFEAIFSIPIGALLTKSLPILAPNSGIDCVPNLDAVEAMLPVPFPIIPDTPNPPAKVGIASEEISAILEKDVAFSLSSTK